MMKFKMILILTVLISNSSYAYYRKDVNDKTSSFVTSASYNDKTINSRMGVLASPENKITMPSITMVAGTAYPERNIDQKTKDIDLKPFTLDSLEYQVYIPLDKMQGTPNNVVISFKTNERFSNAYSMNFGSVSWRDAAGNIYQKKSIYNYRYEGVYVYGSLTDKKEPLSTIWSKYGDHPEHEIVSSSLGFQSGELKFVNNDNGIPAFDHLNNSNTYPIVNLKTKIHPFSPSLLTEFGGNYARTTPPYFSIKNINPARNVNAPLLFTGRFQLRSLNKQGDSRINFVNRPKKYLRVVFFIRGGMLFSNTGSSTSNDSYNTKMDRNIATECKILHEDRENYTHYDPVNLHTHGSGFSDNVYKSALSPLGIEPWALSDCKSKRHEIFPLNYTIFVS